MTTLAYRFGKLTAQVDYYWRWCSPWLTALCFVGWMFCWFCADFNHARWMERRAECDWQRSKILRLANVVRAQTGIDPIDEYTRSVYEFNERGDVQYGKQRSVDE